MNTKNKQHDNSDTASEFSNQEHKNIATELSKMTSEEADIVISNSNIKLFMKK